MRSGRRWRTQPRRGSPASRADAATLERRRQAMPAQPFFLDAFLTDLDALGRLNLGRLRVGANSD